MILNLGAVTICFITVQMLIVFKIVFLCFSGKSSGSVTSMFTGENIFFSESRSMFNVIPKPLLFSLYLSQKSNAYIPAHVAIDTKKRSNGSGAEPSPPFLTDWSVFTVRPS